MVSLSDITIKAGEYRPCIIISNKTEKRKALFHRWNDIANVIGESALSFRIVLF